MPRLSAEQVYAQARGAGLSPAQAIIATAIAKGESGYLSTAVGDVNLQNGTWGPSVGLWQVRTYKPSGPYGGKDPWRVASKLDDPSFAARAMRAISKGGTDWRPWSVYTSGAYRKYLPEAQAAAARVEKGGGAAPGLSVSAPIREGLTRVGAKFGQVGNLWSSGKHTGIDFVAPAGTQVYAVTPGVVIADGISGGPYGTLVRVRDQGGTEHLYAHLSKENVKKGDQVAAGQKIGKVGSTGNSTGAHLHYETSQGGASTNPVAIFQNAGVTDPLEWLAGGGPAGKKFRDKIPLINQLDDFDDIPVVGGIAGAIGALPGKAAKALFAPAKDLLVYALVAGVGVVLIAAGARSVSGQAKQNAVAKVVPG